MFPFQTETPKRSFGVQKGQTAMTIVKLREGEDFIRLGQALKAAGFVESGVEAKFAVQDGRVTVNGETDLRRGRKLYAGDEAVLDGKQALKIEK